MHTQRNARTPSEASRTSGASEAGHASGARVACWSNEAVRAWSTRVASSTCDQSDSIDSRHRRRN